jgi:RNA polymerase sigma-70 factor, ECF subfamily
MSLHPAISTMAAHGQSAPDGSAPLPDVWRLTGRISGGDEAAFEQFYDRFAPRVLGLAMVLASANQTIAAELLQATMIRAARKMKRFDSDEKLWAWLSTIARNAWLDHQRAESRRQAREQIAVPDSPNADASLDAGLAQALNELEPDERQLIQAFYFQRQSQAAIAQAFGLSTRAVEARLARARQKMRKSITTALSHE